jgi:hypothetical protein
VGVRFKGLRKHIIFLPSITFHYLPGSTAQREGSPCRARGGHGFGDVGGFGVALIVFHNVSGLMASTVKLFAKFFLV